jgi:hypothetical protein
VVKERLNATKVARFLGKLRNDKDGAFKKSGVATRFLDKLRNDKDGAFKKSGVATRFLDKLRNDKDGAFGIFFHLVISTKRSAWRNLCRRQRQGSGEERLGSATKVARFLDVGKACAFDTTE